MEIRRQYSMDKRQAGVSFCAISAFLFASKYIAAAIYGSGMPSQGTDLFKLLLEYIGGWLPALGVLSLVTGIMYLLTAEKVFEKLKERSKRR
jgi:hypothetical protein